MIGRIAFGGLAAVVLTGSAFAATQQDTDAASAPDAPPQARSGRDLPRHRLVSILPPARPAFADETAVAPPPPPVAAPDIANGAMFTPVEATPEAEPPRPITIHVLPPARPAFPHDVATAPEAAAAPIEATTPQAQPLASATWLTNLFKPFAPMLPSQVPATGRAQIDALINQHARLNGVPESLVHRIVIRESKYNPRAIGRGGAMGLMQIKTGTARALGYQGGPGGLLDAETNLTYGVKYLAGAYRTAGGNHDRAVSYYARGYYYAARQQGLGGDGRSRGATREADATPPAPATTSSIFSFANAESR